MAKPYTVNSNYTTFIVLQHTNNHRQGARKQLNQIRPFKGLDSQIYTNIRKRS